MKLTTTDRGFNLIEHPHHPPNGTSIRLVQESSAIGDYDDAMDKPGSSFLWIGADHHLNREAVARLVKAMQRWLDTGRLK